MEIRIAKTTKSGRYHVAYSDKLHPENDRVIARSANAHDVVGIVADLLEGYDPKELKEAQDRRLF